jgi:hypothetical protein
MEDSTEDQTGRETLNPYNISMLEDLIGQYIETLDDQDKDEGWATDKEYASSELNKFILWLKNREMQ